MLVGLFLLSLLGTALLSQNAMASTDSESTSSFWGGEVEELWWIQPATNMEEITDQNYLVIAMCETGMLSFDDPKAWMKVTNLDTGEVFLNWVNMYVDETTSNRFRLDRNVWFTGNDNGVYQIEVRAGFKDVNRYDRRITRNVVVNIQDPPEININAYPEGETPHWSVELIEDDSELSEYSVWIDGELVDQSVASGNYLYLEYPIPYTVGDHQITVEATNQNSDSRTMSNTATIEEIIEVVLLRLQVKCLVEGYVEKNGKTQYKSMHKVFTGSEIMALHGIISDEITNLEEVANDFVEDEIRRRNPSDWLEGFVLENYEITEINYDITFTYENYPPIAHFTWEDYPSFPGRRVEFDASSSFDYDGDIVDYRWEFEDGETQYGVHATKYYWFGGELVTLTVWDNDGAYSSISMEVQL